MRTIIVKIQRSLAGTGPALIYNEDRSVLLQCPLKEVISLFDDGEYKVYYKASYNNGRLDILDYVPEPNW